ncbi:MAG: hypothetical protein RR949_03510 [Oscillospiraceae bacterium]
MGELTDCEELYVSMLPLLDAPWLEKCSFGNEFRNEWKRVLRSAARNVQDYSPVDPDAIYAVPHSFEGTDLTFHFDQLKLAEWFRMDTDAKERKAFMPRELTRNIEGNVGIQQSTLRWDVNAVEPLVPEEGKEILVCSLPGFPPPLQTVYGNRRVEGNFHGFKNRKLSIFLVRPELTPAFLCSSFEVCAYLFWMDCCIMMENRPKLKDKDLQPLLHIFRPSSMLKLKGLA